YSRAWSATTARSGTGRVGAGRADAPAPLARLHRRAPAHGAQRAGGAVKKRFSLRPSRAALRFNRRGLRFRVYLLVVVGVLAPAAFIFAVSWVRLEALDEELVTSRRRAAAAVAEHLDEELTASLESLQRLASLAQPALAAGDGDAARALLHATPLHTQFHGGVSLVD